ncbi:hypothetical protein GCM10023107_09180 [Actinoplanes octamycinicus]|nr:hypothetical protein Aoc01nite_10710 [Actinoplanes octamycinicus]
MADGCPACGRGPDADAIEVIRLNVELTELHERLRAARTEVATLEAWIGDVAGRRNTAAARVRVAVRAAGRRAAAPAAVPDAAPATARDAAPGTTPAGPPVVLAGGVVEERPLTALTAQNVLFALGGLLLVVAAAVFTAVAWAQVGVAGRAAILAAATGAVLAVPPFAVRRGLTGAAETLATVGLLMILLDGYAAWTVDFLGVRGLASTAYAAVVCAVASAAAFGYVRLPGPRIAAVVLAQPVFPLLAVAADATATGWSLALTGTAASNVAVLRRVRFATAGAGLVAYVCGVAAAVSSGAAAVSALAIAGGAGSATGAAAAGGALVLVTAVATGAAGLARHRTAQTVTAGLLTVAICVAVGEWALLLIPGTPILLLAVIALAAAVAAALLRSPGRTGPQPPGAAGRRAWTAALARVRLPEPVAQGPWAAALLVATVPAIGVLVAAARVAVSSVETARPLLAAPWAATVAGPGGDLPVAAVTVALAYALLLPAVPRADLALGTLAVVTLLAPAALRLPWWGAAVLGMTVAVVALALAAQAREVRALDVRLAVAAVLAGHAVLVAFGSAGTVAAMFATVALAGVGAAVLVRSGPRRADVGVGGLTTGLLATGPAVWFGLLAGDASATVRVRALLLLAVALCVLARRASGYAAQVTAVALLVTAGAPVWAMAGGDAVSLYAAAGLLLVASLTSVPRGREPRSAAAAAVLVVGLVVATGPDLLAVLAEPYRALESVWSGVVPEPPAGSWTTVAAVLISAVAAAAATRFLTGARPALPAVAAGAAAPLLALAVPLAAAAAGAAWPTVPLSSLIAGLAGLTAVTLRPRPAPWQGPLLVAFGLLALPGLAGSTPARGATLAAFALVVVVGAVIGVAARDEPARIAGWTAGTLSVVVVAGTAADLAALAAGGTALALLAAAAVAAVLEWFLAARRPREAPAVAAVAHATAVLALLHAGTPGRAALIATLWSAVLAVRAVRPGEHRAGRTRYAIAAAGSALVGWWLFLSSRQIGMVELYTVPAALLALAGGWQVRRSRAELPSWTAYGPALAAGFLPSLAIIANSDPSDPQYARRLLLGAGGLVVLLVGVRARLQAPVLAGGMVVVLIALHELVQFWDLVPRWVPLAVSGLLLVGIATTMEQRRRDVLRLRDAVRRMT